MRKMKTYKQLFESEHFDSFELIKDYINEFCDTLDLDLYPNDTEDKIYLKTNSNGIFVWRLLDNKWEKTDDLKKWYYLVIEMRIKDSFRVPNEDEIKNMLNWLVERIDDSEISEGRLELKFISNQLQTWKSKNPMEKTFNHIEKIYLLVNLNTSNTKIVKFAQNQNQKLIENFANLVLNKLEPRIILTA